MHAKIVFAVLILFQLSSQARGFLQTRDGGRSGEESGSSASIQTKGFRTVSDQALQKYVEDHIAQMELVLPTLRDPQTKLLLVHDRIKRISQFRSVNWSKSAFVEQQIDLQIKPFESFPRSEHFRAQRCEQYKNTVLIEWEPSAADKTVKQPGVARALKILKEICS